MRNPKWHRDEIILALDLYFRIDSSKMTSSHPDIIELSELLNQLPIHDVRPDEVKFRNPNGVNLKLNNFKAFDPSYSGGYFGRRCATYFGHVVPPVSGVIVPV